jgi:hypothetical protein
MCIKSKTTQEVREAIHKIELRADECFASLGLLGHHANVAVWSLLVGAIRVIEEQIKIYGDNCTTFDHSLINVSRLLPVAMKWAVEHGKPASTLEHRRWTPTLDSSVAEALGVAHHYSTFLICFPMWHKDRHEFELISPVRVRFTTPGSPRTRQVSAYQKGFRPKEGAYKGQRAKKTDQKPMVRQLFGEVFQNCRETGPVRFVYDDPWDLWRALLPEYEARVDAITRRDALLSLGTYTMGDFKQFYAAFLAVCAAHEFLCSAWEHNSRAYPLDSSLLVQTRSGWITMLARLSGIAPTKCAAIIDYLTLNLSLPTSRLLDLHIQPFVRLDHSTLAVAPQFPLHSRMDENILRVCSILNPAAFDASSLEKENEMRLVLEKSSLHPIQGPIALPKATPDIDLIVSDEASSTIVISEMKWIRKPTRPIETVNRDADVQKGIRQLKQIYAFLADNPDHLRSQGKLPRPLNEYRNVYYMLVTRDHWLWIEPADGITIVEFDVFVAALGKQGGLHSTMGDLLHYDWLPIEGRDFTVRFDTATVNGISIDTQAFYAH